jgi:UDP-2,4-diacetamido-2,4,6-trideoxy-beta-L-altropyranose hydrolase
MLKAAILTEGGPRIGYGHITRCLAIAQAFREKKISPRLYINGDSSVKHILGGADFQICDWLKEAPVILERVKGDDIVIIDSYLAQPAFYRMAAASAGLAVYIDDFKRIRYPAGMVINGSLAAEKMCYPKSSAVCYLLGARYAYMRREFWRAAHKVIRKNVIRLMVTLGGADTKNATPQILRALNKEYPKFYKTVVIGAGFKNLKAIERLKDNRTRLIFSPTAAQMRAMMLKADIAVSAAGQTLYELAKIGVATVAIAVAENQLFNVKGWKDAGFIEYAGFFARDYSSRRLIGSVQRLMPYEQRRMRKDIGRNELAGAGPKNIVKAIIAYAEKKKTS